ncbi:DEAD/DEAH box helicase [Thalassotalea euphylliae]|uniref:DEAD/DEAH box helicase n=1 Tax=Thalassotalea euphylliae TaxID=1655234 RepID=UPI003632573D
MSLSHLDLCPEIVSALEEKGYSELTPIQEKAIPAVLSGRDVMAAAQTGTGKTASFVLPTLQQLQASKKKVGANQCFVLILTPTRELAAQIEANIEAYSKNLSTKHTVVFGGVKINPQMMRLRGGVDILVATPGRLLDLHQQNAVKFDAVDTLVLDEADRMLDMGFIRDINKILALLPKKRQNLLFSATFSPDIRELAKELTHKPVEISVTPENSTAATIEHWLVATDKKKKAPLLNHLIKTENWQQVLVFCRTKHGANRLTRYLEAEGHKAAAIHGNKSQGARTKALAQFKDKTIQVLVATDIAARGIDISQLPQVVNFDLPNVQEDYVHRIGRTGRAGVDGQAISLVTADEHKQLEDIEYVIQKHIPRREVEGFKANNPLPESRPIKPLKAKKPKKPKKPKKLDLNANPKRAEHQEGQRSGQKKHAVNKGQQKRRPQGNKPKAANGNAPAKPSRRRSKPKTSS